MNLAFALDGYVGNNSTPLLFVFDGYLYVSTPAPPIVNNQDGGYKKYYHEEENEDDKQRKIKMIMIDDANIISIFKIYLEWA